MDTTTTPTYQRAVLATFPSKSRPGHVHSVRMGADGNLYCDCPAWKFQHNHPRCRTCKHLQAFEARTTLSGRTVECAGLVPPAPPVRPTRRSRTVARKTSWERL